MTQTEMHKCAQSQSPPNLGHTSRKGTDLVHRPLACEQIYFLPSFSPSLPLPLPSIQLEFCIEGLYRHNPRFASKSSYLNKITRLKFHSHKWDMGASTLQVSRYLLAALPRTPRAVRTGNRRQRHRQSEGQSCLCQFSLS